MGVKGYKAFNKDLTCRDFQYEIGKEFEHKGKIGLCESGFHFCKKIADIQNYYNLKDENTRLCEIEAIGQVDEGNDKCVTNKIKIIREISKEEMYILGNEGKGNTGLGNTGDSNTGNRNIGNRNTGYSNTGDSNTGNRNTGNSNIGYWNTGDWNTGDRNTGYRNTGYRNTGYSNTGDRNTGYRNTGNWNTGDWNKGDRNTGYRNTGYRNTGYSNTGDRNTGYSNTGDRNTGYRNTGNWNTGDWNKTNRSSGVFCNQEPKLIMFNKETNMTWEEWKNSEAYDILTKNKKSQWICYDDMTDTEKEKYPSAKTCNGYLKEIERATSSKEWWNSLEPCEKATIVQLPNFDLDIFNDIMEFKVTKKEYKEILKWIKSNKEIY